MDLRSRKGFASLSLDVGAEAKATTDFELGDLDSPSFWKSSGMWAEGSGPIPTPASLGPRLTPGRSPSTHGRPLGHFAAPLSSRGAGAARSFGAGPPAAAAAAPPPPAPPSTGPLVAATAPPGRGPQLPPRFDSLAPVIPGAPIFASPVVDNDNDMDGSDNNDTRSNSHSRSRSPAGSFAQKRAHSPTDRGRKAATKVRRATRRTGRSNEHDDRKLKKNQREKERRAQVNDKFAELGNVVKVDRASKSDKVTILSQAIQIITSLREEVRQLREEKATKRSPVTVARRLTRPTRRSTAGLVDDDSMGQGAPPVTMAVTGSRLGTAPPAVGVTRYPQRAGASAPGSMAPPVLGAAGFGATATPALGAAVAASAQQYLTAATSASAAAAAAATAPRSAVIQPSSPHNGLGGFGGFGGPSPVPSPGEPSDPNRLSFSGMYSTGLPVPGTPTGLGFPFGDSL